MKERIKAVQRMFWALLAVGAVVALLGVPFGDDANTMDALDELTAFQSKFDRKRLEAALLSHASAQGVVRMQDVAATLRGQQAPEVSAAASAPEIAPSAGVALGTLERIHALGRGGATLEIGAASAQALAAGLAWRLSRREGSTGYELQRIELSAQGCTDADLALEREVTGAREELLGLRAAFGVAQKRHSEAEELVELRRKWKAPWKSIVKANEKRVEMLGAMQTAEAALKKSERRYEKLAKQALAARAGAGASGGTCAIAIATLRELPSGTKLELRMPTPIERKAVPVNSLTGVEFPELHASGLWEELKGGSVEEAIARLHQRFSWHYRYAMVSGVKLGGMTVLQLAPLALLPLFLGLIRRSRGVGALYNPFDRPPNVENLPTVGLGFTAVNLVVLVLLPLGACMLCAWSLVQIDQAPIVPLLAAIGSVGLGGLSHVALKELLELRDAITRSHSHPPPAPSAS